ncbi:MAG: alanine racemase [Arthrospira sp. SH-MAG29]|nr:alanine racemase [Arthrospira sp. SH-MAG29]MBS0018823.1 alanine racemase [Arthrospira sp. SH-MAG29]
MVSRKSKPLAQDDRTYNYEGECEHRAWVEVDCWAIANNVEQIRRLLSPETRFMAVIKADAYGHGAVSVAKIVSEIGVDDFAVATIPEGMELRRLGIQQPILVLGAVHTADEIKAIAHWGLQPTLCTPTQALLFSETLQSIQRSLPVQLNIDTGMSRLGTWWEQALEFVQLVRRLPNLEISGIYSHFATADIRDRTIMDQQHWRFQQVLAQIQEHTSLLSVPTVKPCLHLANSAATLTDPALHYDMVRVGLSLYGLYPAPHLRSVINLQPAMSIRARITQIKTIEAGCGVSYGYKFIAKQRTPIAVVGIGYADGVPRQLSNCMKVLIRGQFVPQIGAITMDQLMLDVTAIPDLQVGEVVTLLGSDRHHSISADDWAQQLGTISWEILCGFKHRLPRILIN